jgi:hypothetical protein
VRFVFLTLFFTIGVAMTASRLSHAQQVDLSKTALLRAAEANNLPLE